MDFILGKKIGMSRLFNDQGQAVPVTVLQAGPCKVIQVKKTDKNGYTALQIGFDENKKASRVKKPQSGHFKLAGKPYRFLREHRIKDEKSLEKLPKIGEEFTVSEFKTGDHVKVTGISKGRGFSGVVKRHRFHGSPKTHGHKHDLRAPGSIGAGFPEHVIKGMRMAGRFGGDKISVQNLPVVYVNAKENILAVKGAVPGANNGYVIIRKREV